MNENNKRFTKATWQIMEQLLNVDDLSEALSGSLEIILKELQSEAGVLWVLDEKENRLYPAWDNIKIYGFINTILIKHDISSIL